MKKNRFFAALASAALGLAFAGCTSYQPIAVGPGVVGERTGEARGVWLFGMPLNADISAATAAANGGITKIATVDVKTLTVLGIVMVRTTIVTGEGGGAETAGGGAYGGRAREDSGQDFGTHSGQFVLDVSRLGGNLGEISDEIKVVNRTRNPRFSAFVEVLHDGEWTTLGKLEFSRNGESEEVEFGRKVKNLGNVSQVKLFPDFDGEYSVNARLDDDDLEITLW